MLNGETRNDNFRNTIIKGVGVVDNSILTHYKHLSPSNN